MLVLFLQVFLACLMMLLVKAETCSVIYSKALQSVVAVYCPDSSHFFRRVRKIAKSGY